MGLTDDGWNDELVAWMRAKGITSAQFYPDGRLQAAVLGIEPAIPIAVSQEDEDKLRARVQEELDKLPFLSA